MIGAQNEFAQFDNSQVLQVEKVLYIRQVQVWPISKLLSTPNKPSKSSPT